jgi:hypothetical protein
MKTGLAVLIFLLIVSPAFAAKKLIRAPKAIAMSFSKVTLSRPTHSAVISFFNLGKVRKIEYALSYMADGISQGVMGSFTPSGESSNNRDLYFGTCSKGVCTPHYNIQQATLLITTTLTSGQINTKRYKFKKV